jgi:Protein kinase domain/Regulator of G protein signaling domain
MGSGVSSPAGRRSSKTECSTVWHEVANKDKYLNSDVLPDVDDIKVHVELLMMLDSPVGQRHLGDYAKLICTQETLFFWTDTLEFQAIPSTDYRRTKAHQLFRKYCLSGSVQALAFVKDAQREQMAALLEAARVDSQHALIEPDFFQPLRKACFLEILEQTYLRFKSDAVRFSAYEAEASSTYNCVCVDDFDYMEKLGSGAFGRVVRVRKRTTQRHYAMKVQHKRALVHHYRDDPSRLHSEKAALATCSHPFILRMVSAHLVAVAAQQRSGRSLHAVVVLLTLALCHKMLAVVSCVILMLVSFRSRGR